MIGDIKTEVFQRFFESQPDEFSNLQEWAIAKENARRAFEYGLQVNAVYLKGETFYKHNINGTYALYTNTPQLGNWRENASVTNEDLNGWVNL